MRASRDARFTGKDESGGMRCSNALLAKAETTLLVNDGLITTMKTGDGQRGQKFPFEIKIVNLWENDKGKVEGAPVAIERERGASLGTVDDSEDDPALTRLIHLPTSSRRGCGCLGSVFRALRTRRARRSLRLAVRPRRM